MDGHEPRLERRDLADIDRERGAVGRVGDDAASGPRNPLVGVHAHHDGQARPDLSGGNDGVPGHGEVALGCRLGHALLDGVTTSVSVSEPS